MAVRRVVRGPGSAAAPESQMSRRGGRGRGVCYQRKRALRGVAHYVRRYASHAGATYNVYGAMQKDGWHIDKLLDLFNLLHDKERVEKEAELEHAAAGASELAALPRVLSCALIAMVQRCDEALLLHFSTPCFIVQSNDVFKHMYVDAQQWYPIHYEACRLEQVQRKRKRKPAAASIREVGDGGSLAEGAGDGHESETPLCKEAPPMHVSTTCFIMHKHMYVDAQQW